MENEKPQKIYISHEEAERIKKSFEERGFKIPDKQKHQKGKKVIQRKHEHVNDNPCTVCGKTNWNHLVDGRKYCLVCGGIDTDKKPIVGTPEKQKREEITDFELVVTLPEKKPKKQKSEEITDFIMGE